MNSGVPQNHYRNPNYEDILPQRDKRLNSLTKQFASLRQMQFQKTPSGGGGGGNYGFTGFNNELSLSHEGNGGATNNGGGGSGMISNINNNENSLMMPANS
jgi:hypothetical protein